jgi:hypothetical protein
VCTRALSKYEEETAVWQRTTKANWSFVLYISLLIRLLDDAVSEAEVRNSTWQSVDHGDQGECGAASCSFHAIILAED